MSLMRHPSSGRERGIAAVELALIMPCLVVLLAFPLFLGHVLWHYTAMQNAAQDAARYLSKAPLSDMTNPARAIAVASVADAIIARDLASVAPGALPYLIDVTCDGASCGGYSRPSRVGATIQILMTNGFFTGYMSLSIPLTVSVTYPYMGR